MTLPGIERHAPQIDGITMIIWLLDPSDLADKNVQNIWQKDDVKKLLETNWYLTQDVNRNTNVNADFASILECSGEILQMLS